VGRLEDISGENNRPTIGRREKLDMGQLLLDLEGGAPGPDPQWHIIFSGFGTVADFGLTSAIYNGFDNSTLNQKAAFACQTGNCTWPVFTSLAICSACNDVSTHIIKTSGYTVGADITDQYLPSGLYPSGSFTNYSLTYVHMKYFSDFSRLSSNGDEDVASVYLTANATTDFRETLSFKDSNTLLMAFAVMRARPEFLSNTSLWSDSTPTAIECGLFFCVNSYRTISQNGLLKEELVDSWAVREPRSWRASDTGRPEVESSLTKYQKWDVGHPSLSHQGMDDRVFRTDLQLLIPTESNSVNNTTGRFNISQTMIASTQDFLLDWSIGQTWVPQPQGQPNKVIVYPIGQNFEARAFPLAEVLWSSDNLTETFANVAQTLTSRIRDSSSITQPGTGRQWVVYIEVDWPFIILPLTTVILGMIYIVIIIMETGRLGLPAWKQSAIPALAYGFPQQTQTLMRNEDLNQTHPSWSTTRKMMIKFNDDGDGLKAPNVATT
jgi:hypothetical protein